LSSLFHSPFRFRSSAKFAPSKMIKEWMNKRMIEWMGEGLLPGFFFHSRRRAEKTMGKMMKHWRVRRLLFYYPRGNKCSCFQ
jgi:hypothetical protein